MTYKRNWPSELGGASIMRVAVIGDNTVFKVKREHLQLFPFPIFFFISFEHQSFVICFINVVDTKTWSWKSQHTTNLHHKHREDLERHPRTGMNSSTMFALLLIAGTFALLSAGQGNIVMSISRGLHVNNYQQFIPLRMNKVQIEL